MAVFFWFLMTYPVSVQIYIRQVTFHKVPEKPSHVLLATLYNILAKWIIIPGRMTDGKVDAVRWFNIQNDVILSIYC